MGKKVLNQYIPIVNGTAFMVNDNGYLITAFHVVKYLPADKMTEYCMWSFEEFLSKNMIPGYLTKTEIHDIFKEYMAIVKESELVVSLKSKNKKDYKAQIIAKDDNLDLALLKIDIEDKISPIVIKETKHLHVGEAVITIGYPLQSTLYSFLDDFKPTVTNGINSAIRNDKWDIQHTASLNGGNSGGPLFLEDGSLAGVNVGTITQANNIYFSTNSGKLLEWLKSIGKSDIIIGN